MAHGGALGMNRAGETNAPIWGKLGIWCCWLCQTCTPLDTRLTLPPIFAERGIRFGGTARCKYTNLPDFHGEHSQH